MKAHEIMMISRNANEAMNLAGDEAREIDQDWDDEATLYTFDDDSVLVVSGSQVNAYDDWIAAVQDFPNADTGE